MGQRDLLRESQQRSEHASTIRRHEEAEETNGILRLQRMVGNRSVLEQLGAQAKMEVGAADDVLEHEADSVASTVVQALRSSDPVASPSSGAGEGVARSIQRREDSAAPIGYDGGEISPDVEQSLNSARGSGGSPLPAGIRRSMEGAFGADFSGVRVHEGSTSAGLNQQMGAKAFTVGNDIFFRDGMPDTGSSAGQHLLAHELTHTVQQGAAGVSREVDPLVQREEEDEEEMEE